MQNTLFLIGLHLFLFAVIATAACIAIFLIRACYPKEFKEWFDRQTMAVGERLIGSRPTSMEKDRIDKIINGRELLSSIVVSERDKAIRDAISWENSYKEKCDALFHTNKRLGDLREYHDTCFQELKSLRKKHNSLQARFKKLKPKPVAKRKAVNK